MNELRYPNESREYRDARDAMLKDEQDLVAKMKAVAAKRRTLPPGGELKEDYVFQWASEGKVGHRVRFSELFGDKSTLLIYSFMFGPNCSFLGTESMSNHLDTVWPYWNLMDYTPEGRPEIDTPPHQFRSLFLEKHYLNKK